MSTSINELEEIVENNIKQMNIDLPTQDNKIMKIEESNDIDDITIDEILDTQELLDNKFISYLNKNTNIENDAYYSDIIYYYLNKIYDKLEKGHSSNFLYLLFKFIQIIFYLWLVIGIFTPKNIIPFHSISCIIAIILLEYTNNDGLVNNFLINYFNLDEKNIKLMDENPNIIKISIFTLLCISMYCILFPKYSIFMALSYYINFFKI